MTAAWALEWRVALRRRRLFYFNVIVPLVLVSVVSGAGAPAHHAAAIYAVLFVMFATFGSAIPWVRDGETGWRERLALRGASPWSLVLGRSAAATLLDLLQLAPSVLLILLAGDHRASHWVAMFWALAISLGAANLLGCWVAATARSVAEAALFSATVSLFLLHGAGTFRTPMPGSTGAAIQVWIPFRLLHETLLAVANGGLLPTLISWPISLWATLSLTAATALAAPRLVARLSRPEA